MSSNGPGSRDLFRLRYEVPVSGGTLAVAHAGLAPDQADTVVLAIHGVTSNLMVWRSVARHLEECGSVSIVAPDLRGRGESAKLPGPYGIASHVRDMLDVLDYFGVERAVLAGHSMGAYVATRLAEEHPERAAALVLVDGGPSLDAVSPEAAALMRAVIVGPALARQAMPHGSTDSWLDFWRQHPAFVDAWNKDVECYVLHDLVVDAGSVGYRINLNAVEADSDDMLSDPASRTSMDRVDLPLTLVRASQGTLGDENPMIPCSVLEAFTAEHPAAHVEALEDVNHYTVILGDSPGPGRVAAAIEAAARIAR